MPALPGNGERDAPFLRAASDSDRHDPLGPSLRPSIGNWQRPCKSHYWVDRGKIEWSAEWTPEQIAAGRAAEERRREHYYAELYAGWWWVRIWRWLKSIMSS
ncbi:DUF6527 family protein [Rhizobium leguminosarum]|uniref:DUF6527 family protein n=1 Tax=Rhizobium leguminosarum TaxID=384 RepID=UPI0032B13A4B